MRSKLVLCVILLLLASILFSQNEFLNYEKHISELIENRIYKDVNNKKLLNMRILKDGVLSIKEGEHPRMLGDEIKIYLNEEDQKQIGEN